MELFRFKISNRSITYCSIKIRLTFWQIKANRGDNADVPRLIIMKFCEALPWPPSILEVLLEYDL